ncbi:hypothetical protein ASC77_19935 [Nocardioides sp. Root1257]|uniref:hypothetical protein n=1 Tax=unclassified Nocardioides TaxID=2615069 RepID=UPI0006FECF4C|nr:MULTISPECIES: hypothetical protein [unclassified Nocardioides]KQW45054.1 hypothetical protein ASC77_19935 [Nocardioides sp. Root1257]KRC45942.1 hypothetical protein ASE24_15285 [Nocardioides sp. Root224]
MTDEALRLTKDELLAAYPDPKWQRSFFEVQRIIDFLSGSILQEKYKVPDDLSRIVHLTEHGNQVLNKLVSKHEVNPKVARLLCLLQLVHREPLVDLQKTDVEELRSWVDQQVRGRDLLFPFIAGRDLYDRAAELFEEARDSLSHADTLKLLDGLPIGVFQSGPFVSGPYGLLRGLEQRWFAPIKTVPMYHCSELTCGAVHRCRLSSDYSAPINEHWSTLERVVESYGLDDSEWGEFVEEIGGVQGHRFDDRSTEPMVLVLTDLLADDELRILLSDVLDNSAGSLRSMVEPLGLIGKADDIAEKQGRAELIQLLLLAPNDVLLARLDKLIVNGGQPGHTGPAIRVEAGEVRRLMTNRGMGYGTFGTYPEISPFGVRFTSDDFALGPMRLKRLVEALYSMDDHGEVDELQWQLREVEGDDPHEQLEEFVRSAEPDDVIARLILARRTNQILACEKLGLDYDDFSEDGVFVDATLWKLGFYNQELLDPNREFWDHHGRLKRYAQTAGVGARVDAGELRSRAVNYFVELERVLDDTLAFATWAMVNDHLAADRPFAYEPSAERARSFARLNEQEELRDSGDEVIRLGEENTLFPLVRGFGILADLLERLRAETASHQRDLAQYPRYAAFTTLKSFPFVHTAPFLDLLPKSQDRVIESLRHVRKTLEAAAVHEVRNDYMHYRASATDLPRLDQSLDAAQRAVGRLEADGLCRTMFALATTVGDRWDRRVFTLRSAKGRELAFARPGEYDWNRMPTLRGIQYVVPAAVFARPNEMLRFRPVFKTRYAEYWDDFPKPRQRRSGVTIAADVHQDAVAP